MAVVGRKRRYLGWEIGMKCFFMSIVALLYACRTGRGDAVRKIGTLKRMLRGGRGKKIKGNRVSGFERRGPSKAARENANVSMFG